MAHLVLDCPHCETANNFFGLVSAQRWPADHLMWTTFHICPNCHKGLTCVLRCSHSGMVDISARPGDLRAPMQGQADFVLQETHPKKPESEVPGHLPPAVAKAFKEGCDILSKSASGACAQFRKALELALKDKSPDVGAWRLEKRIDAMAQAGLLTDALKDWAHKLRLDGNGAVHDLADITRESAQEMESLTRFVLMYLFTLPESVRLAQSQG